MRILTEQNLNNYVKPFAFSGYDAALIPQGAAVFDIFDTFLPDIYITTMSQLTKARVKNILERPALKTVVLADSPTTDFYKQLVDNGVVSLVFYANEEDFKAKSLAMKSYADIFLYKDAEKNPRYESDVVCIEDNLTTELDNYYFDYKLRYRIFSNVVVNHSNYCGFLAEPFRKTAYKSSKVALCSKASLSNARLAEAHAIEFGTSVQDILDCINTDHSASIKEKKEEVLESLTTFHFCATILENLGENPNKLLAKLKEVL